jgi:hypothetical protein
MAAVLTLLESFFSQTCFDPIAATAWPVLVFSRVGSATNFIGPNSLRKLERAKGVQLRHATRLATVPQIVFTETT